MFGELLAFICLEAADHVPIYCAGEEAGFLVEFLDVVFAEVSVRRRCTVQGEDVGGGFEFGNGY